MRVVVASHNPVKLGAVRDAFTMVFGGRQSGQDRGLELVSVDVPSGVSEQPRSDQETRLGAHNRARAGRQALAQADFWVGLEGGLERLDGTWLASAWMVVLDGHGRFGEARTPTLPLPRQVQALIDEGLELGEANDRVFGTRNSKRATGAFGLLTGGRMTRRSVYAQTVELALLPLVHELWREPRR